ncbi:MAG: hypothetical protein CBE47_03380 [Pelagibacteraceae bacterium TMED287]|nr:MAG: hypothetical protein CBE47_03380 [Pelagibacteraceae bacterium TMED287]
MADRVRVSDLDFVYISFREPNKEENWADLKNKVPWAKRVDGVVGFDSAHKAAAKLAETDFFISVDGDNVIDERFLLETLDWTKTNPKAVHRWRAKNNVNGLVYGNGGLVGWNKETCLTMKTHENADSEKNKMDFCWGIPHENLHNCYSETVINVTPQQAFIAGFREGVKMCNNNGVPIPPREFKNIWPINLRVLSTWCTVGADVENGKFAMLGARMGSFYTVVDHDNYDFNVSDLDGMADYFHNTVQPANIDSELEMWGNSLRQQLDMPIAEFNDEDSRFYRFVMPLHVNRGVQDREYK